MATKSIQASSAAAGENWSDGITPATTQVNHPVKTGEILTCYCGHEGRFTETTSITRDVDAHGRKIAKFSEEVRYWCPRCRSEVRPAKQ